jgi:hypothetical protein
MATVYGQSAGAGEKSVRALGLGGYPSVERATTLPGTRYHGLVESLLHDSPVSDLLWASGTAVLWRVLEHPSTTVRTDRYLPMLRLAYRLLSSHTDVMVLADRGFANHDLIEWLSQSRWHYGLRVPSDGVVHGPRRHPVEVGTLWPPKGEARFYEGIGLWLDGRWRCNLVLAKVKGVKEPWAVITDEPPTLNTLWQYALRFRVEELFLDSTSGVFELEASGIRSAQALKRLYLVAAIAILYGTTQGMAVQLDGLRSQVDPHWTRGISYLNIGLRWLRGVVNKGRPLFHPIALFTVDPDPCFASKRAEARYYDRIWFSKIQSLHCQLPPWEAA